MDASQVKALKIKIGALKRNVKDVEYSEKELAKEQGRLVGYEAQKDDEKIYQQKKVIDEAQTHVPIALQRLKACLDDVLQFASELPPPPAPAVVAVAVDKKPDGGAAAEAADTPAKKDGDDDSGSADDGAGVGGKTTASPGASTLNSSVSSAAAMIVTAAEEEVRVQLNDAIEIATTALKMRGIEVENAKAAAGAAAAAAGGAAEDDDY